jgi:hypothetical protein
VIKYVSATTVTKYKLRRETKEDREGVRCLKTLFHELKILTTTGTQGSSINISTTSKQFIHNLKVTTLSSKVERGQAF